jgi:RimJ/RimL family protein N-acetyltransferase
VSELRPLEPSDRDRLVRMFDRLSPATVQRRFFTLVQHLDGRLLESLVDVDHLDREALVLVEGDEIIGIAHYYRVGHGPSAEIAVLVEDAWQHQGLGRKLMRALGTLALERGITSLEATVLSQNDPALKLLRKLAPEALMERDGTEVHATAPLLAA